MADICVVDKTPIKTMCFKGTGVCCERCRKIRDGEHRPCIEVDPWSIPD